MKICTLCKEEKKLTEFKKNAKCRDGVTGSCKVCVNSYLKSWRDANPDHSKGNRSEVGKKYYNSNKDKILLYSAEHRKANLHKYAFYAMKRHNLKLKATPPWLSETQYLEIAAFYEIAKWYDEPMHVDHIVPLQGKNVCGLHVPWNLQLLPALENISKGNRFHG